MLACFVLHSELTFIVQINGKYVCQSSLLAGRHVFRFNDHNLYLYYHARRGAWVVSDCLNSSSPIAFVVDNAGYPGGRRLLPIACVC